MLRLLSQRSGCLDALTAPEVARQLDAFVTKTVTPLRARETRRTASPRPRRGCSTRWPRQPRPGHASSPNAPSLPELGVPLWVSVGGFSAARVRRDMRAARGGRGDRAQPLLPERRRGAGVGRRDRRRLPCGDDAAPVREALTGRARTSPRSPARSRLPGRTGSRSSTRSAASRSTRDAGAGARHGDGGLLGPCAEADCAGRRLRRRPRRCRSSGWEVSRPVATRSSCRGGRVGVALGTVLFADPDAPGRIQAEFATELARLGLARRTRSGCCPLGGTVLAGRLKTSGQKRLADRHERC